MGRDRWWGWLSRAYGEFEGRSLVHAFDAVERYEILLHSAASIIDAAGITAVVVAPDEGVFEVWGGATVSVQPAARTVRLGLGRDAVTKFLERASLRIGGQESYRTRRYRLFMRRSDTVELTALAGALGDVGVVWVSMQQLTR